MALNLLIAGVLVVLSSSLLASGTRLPKVLSDAVHIVNVDVDDATGELSYSKWVPSDDDINNANEVLVDSEERVEMSGVNDGGSYVTVPLPRGHSDYIDLKRNFSRASRIQQANSVTAVVELVIVCDKEFADVFGRDNARILEYLTVYMWDVNMRFKSLPRDNISIRVNGIVVISSAAAQPFIEQARGSDGRVEFGRILDRFGNWVYAQQNGLVAKHDVTLLMTNAAVERAGGQAIGDSACWVDETIKRDNGIAVINDEGFWGSVVVAAHEIAHMLGALHDDDADFPGGCSQQGFIMGVRNDEHQNLFSECSDRTISAFVRSDKAACLRRIDGSNSPAIDPSYSSPKALSTEEMCKRVFKSSAAFIQEKDKSDCKKAVCLNPTGKSGEYAVGTLPPVENSVCGNGRRCFRGVCREEGLMLKNEGSGLCMIAANSFEFMAPARMISCPRDGTPLERLVLRTSPNGYNLAAPFLFNKNEENGEKCLYTGTNEGDAIWTDRCNADNPWHGWEFRNTGTGKYLLVHKLTGRCAKPKGTSEGTYVETWKDCNPSDSLMLWSVWSSL